MVRPLPRDGLNERFGLPLVLRNDENDIMTPSAVVRCRCSLLKFELIELVIMTPPEELLRIICGWAFIAERGDIPAFALLLELLFFIFFCLILCVFVLVLICVLFLYSKQTVKQDREGRKRILFKYSKRDRETELVALLVVMVVADYFLPGIDWWRRWR